MQELNSQQIDAVNGGGILTGALIGIAAAGMRIGYSLTSGGAFSCLPCVRPAPAPKPVQPPTSSYC